MKKVSSNSSPHGLLYISSLALLLLSPLSSNAVVDFDSVKWFTWSPVANPGASIGSADGQSASVTVTGTHAADAGAATANFDTEEDESYSLAVPYLGLGAPRNDTSVTYTIDLSSLTIPTSNLVIGFFGLDAVNNRGSLTVSAQDDLSQASNVNTWTTAGQFKLEPGAPFAQALVTRTAVSNSMVLGSTQGADNSAWGDSRGIFFSDLAPNLSSISVTHQYGHPNPSISDNIGLYIGVVPEPSTWGLLAGSVCLLFVFLKRKSSQRKQWVLAKA